MVTTQATRQRILLVNLVTASRLVFAAGVAVLTLWSRDQRWAIIASTALILAIEISDFADGHLARKHGAVSVWGKMFDPYVDSLSRLTVYWSLAVTGRCLAFVPLLMAMRDVTTAYARILLVRSGRDIGARFTGKLKAVVQGVCALLLMAGPLYCGRWEQHLIYVLSFLVAAVTLASLVDYGRAALRRS